MSAAPVPPPPSPAGRPYHHGNLRAALVAAGVELAAQSGPSAILLREAARRVGVSHNAGYRHFAGREQLVAAVAEQGMNRLARAMTAALAGLGDRPADPPGRARARLRAIGGAYVGFALSEPGLFRTAFAAGDPAVGDTTAGDSIAVDPAAGGDPAAGDPAVARSDSDAGPGTPPGPYEILSGVVDEFVTAGVLPAADRPHSEVAAWAAVHGLATLVLDGPLQSLPAHDVEAALERLFAVVEAGLGPPC